jgi:hypothetical protein
LGSRRHLCCRRRRYTDADADAYCYSHRNSDAATDGDPQVGAITKTASHAFAETLDLTVPKISGDGGPGIASSY